MACYYQDPETCSGELWTCMTCGEAYCQVHWHETSEGGNVECVVCELERENAEEEELGPDFEFDLHFWVEPEDKVMYTQLTISHGERHICYSMPIERAMKALEEFIREQVEEA